MRATETYRRRAFEGGDPVRRDESVARQEKFATEGEALTYEMAATAARPASEMFARDVVLIDLKGLSPTPTTS